MDKVEAAIRAVKESIEMIEKMNISRLLIITACGMALLLCWNFDAVPDLIRALAGR